MGPTFWSSTHPSEVNARNNFRSPSTEGVSEFAVTLLALMLIGRLPSEHRHRGSAGRPLTIIVMAGRPSSSQQRQIEVAGSRVQHAQGTIQEHACGRVVAPWHCSVEPL